MIKRDGMLGTAALRERGWTPSLIKRFLGKPDMLVPIPPYSYGRRMKLFAEQRVIAAESDPAFMEEKEMAEKRSQSAKAAAQARRKSLLAQVETIEITVNRIRPDYLLQETIAHYNTRQAVSNRGDAIPASEDSDPDFLDRIQVNYIRHHLTMYDMALECVQGKVGVDDAVWRIRERVYEAIAAAYPELAHECNRQILHRVEWSLMAELSSGR